MHPAVNTVTHVAPRTRRHSPGTYTALLSDPGSSLGWEGQEQGQRQVGEGSGHSWHRVPGGGTLRLICSPGQDNIKQNVNSLHWCYVKRKHPLHISGLNPGWRKEVERELEHG